MKKSLYNKEVETTYCFLGLEKRRRYYVRRCWEAHDYVSTSEFFFVKKGDSRVRLVM